MLCADNAQNWVGKELQIVRGDYHLPEYHRLPDKLLLCSVWVHRHGVLLGQRWYLQTGATPPTPEDELDLVSPTDVHGSLQVAQEFLSHHGYRWVENSGSNEYVRKSAGNAFDRGGS